MLPDQVMLGKRLFIQPPFHPLVLVPPFTFQQQYLALLAFYKMLQLKGKGKKTQQGTAQRFKYRET